MTNIKQLIQFLSQFPEDTELSVLESSYCGYDCNVQEVALDLDPVKGNVEFTDLTGNPFIHKGDKLFNKKYLVFGKQE